MGDGERNDIVERLIRIETHLEIGNKSMDEYKLNTAALLAKTDSKANKAHERIDLLAENTATRFSEERRANDKQFSDVLKGQARSSWLWAGVAGTVTLVILILRLTGKL